MSDRRIRIFAACLAGCLLPAACGQPANNSAMAARNCHQASEGERLFAAHRPRLAVAKDWAKVGWTKQVVITKWMACRHKLTNHAPIDDCLDRVAYSQREAEQPFASALENCIRRAVQKQAG